MRLADIVHPNMIWAELASRDKTQVILELAEKISSNLTPIKAEEISSMLLSREGLGSTGIQDGIAIPHAKIQGLENIVVACGRSKQGIDFDAPDQKPTHLFFVLLAPEHSAAIHLKILARLSRLLKDKAFRDKLIAVKTAKDIYKTIIEEDAKN